MCESLAEGGRRCAAHTRPAFDEAIAAIVAAPDDAARNEARAQGIGAVAAHASTRTGATEVAALREAAEQGNAPQVAAWLATCERLGASQRDAANAVRRAIQAQRTQTPLPAEVDRGTIVYLAEATTTHHGVEYMRRGTYGRVVHNHARTNDVPDGEDPTRYVTITQLPFRPGDQNRVKRGPHDSPLRPTTNDGFYAVPRTALRLPAETDDTANHFRERTINYEGNWYTEAEIADLCADLHGDELADFQARLFV